MIFYRVIFTILFVAMFHRSGVYSKKSSNTKTGGTNTNNNFPSSNVGSKTNSNNLASGVGSKFSPTSGGGGIFKSRTSQLVAAGLAGAAVGVGGAMVINAATGSYHSPSGQTYYYDRYYRSSSSPYRTVCHYYVHKNDTIFGNATYEDKTLVKEILYECDTRSEECCELECCKIRRVLSSTPRSSLPWWGSLLIFILFASIFGLAGYCVWAKVKRAKRLNNCQPDATYVVTSAPGQTNLYPGQSLPPASNYFPQPPTAGYANSGYPQAPPNYPANPPQQNYGQQSANYNQYPAYPNQAPNNYNQNPVYPQQPPGGAAQGQYNPQFPQPQQQGQQWNQQNSAAPHVNPYIPQ